MDEVTIYTDGACLGNPGPGGYGAVLSCRGREMEVSGGYRLTTNSRMEILAVIRALETLKKPCRITLHSDSRYVVDAMTKGWAIRWRANGWIRNNRGDEAANPDLWERLLDLADYHDPVFTWVKGHAGIRGNVRADRLASAAARNSADDIDVHYEEKAA